METRGIFISWSGEASLRIAECLRATLPFIFRVEPWLSSRDIPPGRPWLQELMGQLESIDVGVLVITPENIDSPWMQFEAGALCKNFDHSRVFPYLVGLECDQIRGPFGHFQAIQADQDGTATLVESIRGQCVPDELPGTVIERFNAFWPRISNAIKDVTNEVMVTQDGQSTAPAEYQRKIDRLEERLSSLTALVKDVAQSLDSERVNDSVDEDGENRADAFVGGWHNMESGTHAYGRIVNGRLHMPYCYGGNGGLTAAYTNWTPIGSRWFTRFRWFDGDIHGFGFFQPIGKSRIEGKWWIDDDPEFESISVEEAVCREADREGVPTVWERIPDSEVPIWAENYFRSIE